MVNEEIEFEKGTSMKHIKQAEHDFRKELLRKKLKLSQEKFDELFRSAQTFLDPKNEKRR
ncbi:MAG: hypothetical protein CMI54_04220 [Parcubacteria group bacterium]|nr:hypothetical protein [Parcubacteria group bacterium]|tara:strand:+ start:446 stop:625 length:180 start_codon:yes stop_codon:yes gene_type:complete